MVVRTKGGPAGRRGFIPAVFFRETLSKEGCLHGSCNEEATFPDSFEA